jgi:hypothetical protein
VTFFISNLACAQPVEGVVLKEVSKGSAVGIVSKELAHKTVVIFAGILKGSPVRAKLIESSARH